MKSSRWVISFSLLPVMLVSGHGPAQADYYIRSQHPGGTFTGSHEILESPKSGYLQARYCERTFWVRPTTVAWSEEEVAAGRTLVLEENSGSTRTALCADTKAFARLEDLGLEQREIDSLRASDAPYQTRASRLHTIRDAFKQYK